VLIKIVLILELKIYGNCNGHVSKVVDLVARIPKDFSLNFYDFSMVFKQI
jgi:hypothetical protein